jgi:hypothetical protein
MRCLGNVESYIPDVLQPLSFEQGSTGGGCASRDYTFTRAGDRVEFSSQTVCTSHSLRPCQCWEELSDVAVAARWAVDVYQAAHRSLLPSQCSRVYSVLVSFYGSRGFRRLILVPHRLQEETARVEDKLAKPKSLDALLKCFVSAKAGSFENLLDPFLKICRLSTPIAIGIAKAQFFRRITEKLGNSKAVVKLNLLRILRTVCDVHPNRALLVERYGIHETVASLRRNDGAVLVRELAKEIEPSLAPALKPSFKAGIDTPKSTIAPKKRVSAPGAPRRTASDTSGLCTPSPPSFVFGSINPRVTSAGTGTTSKTRRHDSVSTVVRGSQALRARTNVE